MCGEEGTAVDGVAPFRLQPLPDTAPPSAPALSSAVALSPTSVHTAARQAGRVRQAALHPAALSWAAGGSGGPSAAPFRSWLGMSESVQPLLLS